MCAFQSKLRLTHRRFKRGDFEGPRSPKAHLDTVNASGNLQLDGGSTSFACARFAKMDLTPADSRSRFITPNFAFALYHVPCAMPVLFVC